MRPICKSDVAWHLQPHLSSLSPGWNRHVWYSSYIWRYRRLGRPLVGWPCLRCESAYVLCAKPQPSSRTWFRTSGLADWTSNGDHLSGLDDRRPQAVTLWGIEYGQSYSEVGKRLKEKHTF